MNDNSKFRLGGLGLIAVIAPLVIVLLQDPDWALIVIMALADVLLVCVAVGVVRLIRHRDLEVRAARQELYRWQQPVPPETAAPSPTTAIVSVPVSSAEADYAFLASGTVCWAPADNGRPLLGDPAALAKNAVLNRIQEITRMHRPDVAERLQHEIAAELSVHRLDAGGSLYVWADGVTLTLDEDDAVRLKSLAAVRKSELVWEHERRFEVSKRDYLGNDVLSTTGSAVVWWLARDHGKVTETVDLIGTIRRLTAAANDRTVPTIEPVDRGPRFAPAAAPVVPPTVALVDAMFPDVDSGQRDLFSDQLADFVSKYGHEELAHDLRSGQAAPTTTVLVSEPGSSAEVPPDEAAEPEPEPESEDGPVPLDD